MDLKHSFCPTGIKGRMVVIGDRYGLLTVIADVFNSYPRRVLAKCECGVVKEFHLNALRQARQISCGCARKSNVKHDPKDYIGEKFGRLTVLGESSRIGTDITALCKCECGNQVKIRFLSIIHGKTQSCGCLRKERVSKATFLDLTGKKFGKLTAIKRVENKKGSHLTRWLCRCDCGKEKVVSSNSLMKGNTTSCGCRKTIMGGRSWTEDEENELIKMLNDGMTLQEISRKTQRSVAAIRKRLDSTKNLKRCRAKDCDKYYFNKSQFAKYCSDRCRWRENKRNRVEHRKKEGLCPQCGGKMSNKDEPYCDKCTEYFKKRYESLKGKTDEPKGTAFKNEVGKTYGRLQVVELMGLNKKGVYEYKCICDCGKNTIVQGTYLRTGETTSCGCAKLDQDEINLRKEYEDKRVNGVALHLFDDKPRKHSSTGYRGVFSYKTRVSKEDRYGAWITVKGKRFYKKGFYTPEDAYYNGRLILEKEHLPKKDDEA